MVDSPYVERITADKSPLWKDNAPILGRLDFELTERCNNNCIHCCINLPLDDAEARRRELSTDEIHRILLEAATLGCLEVRFTGGEPLVREDFENIYLFARRLGLKVYIFTNATLIDEHWANLLARVPPLEPMEITIYGMTRRSYEGVSRMPGTYEAAWRGVNLLLDRKVPFIVKGALLPPNLHEREQFIAWAATIPWMEGPPTYSMFFEKRARRDSERKDRLIGRVRLDPVRGTGIAAEMSRETQEQSHEFCRRFMGPPGENLFSCGAGIGVGNVDAYGFFQPCLALRHPETVYDLRKGALKDALTRFFPELRKLKATNPEYLARCAKCFLKGLCEQCPAKSWSELGTLDTPVEYLCQVAHAEGRRLGLLGEGEKPWEVTDWRERIAKLAKSNPD